MQKKPKSKTLAKRNGLRVAKYSLKAGQYIAPVTPIAVETGINWQEWFVNSNGFKVGMGFVMIAVSTLLTYFSIAKKKKLFEGRSAFWSVAVLVISWGLAAILLANILNQLGYMMLYIGFSCAASAVMDETETLAVEKKLAEYSDLVSTYGLDSSEVKKKEKAEKRRQLAEEEAQREREARRRAVE